MKNAKIVALGYDAENRPTCLYAGESRAEADAAVQDAAADGPHVRATIHVTLPQPDKLIEFPCRSTPQTAA